MILFHPFALGEVPLKDHLTAVVTRVHVILHALAQRRIIRLIRERDPFGHDATKRFLVGHLREFLPQHFPDELRGILADDFHLVCCVLEQ